MTMPPIAPDKSLISVDRVAEALWQSISGSQKEGIEAYHAWLALPAAEQESWRVRAKAAIEDWRIAQGFPPAPG